MIENLDQLGKILDLPNEKQIQLSNLFLEFLKTKDAQDLIGATEETLLSKFNINAPIIVIENNKNFCKFILNNGVIISITLTNTYTVCIEFEYKNETSNSNYFGKYSGLTETDVIKILRNYDII